MSLEPLKIPQNVYIEDRIVGPLTLRQIMIVGIGSGISYAIWGMVTKAYPGGGIVLTVLAWIPAVISAAFAFVKINDLSLLRLMLLRMEQMKKPSIRAFGPRQGISIHIRTFSEPVKQHMTISPEKIQEYQRLNDLSTILDTPLQRAAQQQSVDGITDGAEQEVVVRDASAPVVTEEVATPVLPVNRNRIKATPLTPEQETAEASKASVSIFRDIVAK